MRDATPVIWFRSLLLWRDAAAASPTARRVAAALTSSTEYAMSSETAMSGMYKQVPAVFSEIAAAAAPEARPSRIHCGAVLSRRGRSMAAAPSWSAVSPT